MFSDVSYQGFLNLVVLVNTDLVSNQINKITDKTASLLSGQCSQSADHVILLSDHEM